MNEWKCPIEDVDEDIRKVVELIYNNNMKPYMSCSGSYKDHKDKPYLPETGCIEMLDSELTRELIAVLINDEKYKCSISKEKECTFYDNDLPTGFRFKIEFENIYGNIQNELEVAIQVIAKGQKAEMDNRNKIDMTCSILDTYDVEDGNSVKFSFNDEMIKEENEENYSIEIRAKRDFEEYEKTIDHAINGFMQDEEKCKIYGNDFLSMLSVLRKIRMDYYKIPKLNEKEKPQEVQLNEKRINRFTINYDGKIKNAKERSLTGNSFHSETVNFEDLVDLFSEEK